MALAAGPLMRTAASAGPTFKQLHSRRPVLVLQELEESVCSMRKVPLAPRISGAAPCCNFLIREDSGALREQAVPGAVHAVYKLVGCLHAHKHCIY